MDFIWGKVKANLTNLSSGFDQHSSKDQKKLISYAIPRTRAVLSEKNDNLKQVETELISRMQQKMRTKESSERKKMEKHVANLSSQGNVTERQICELILIFPKKFCTF